MMRKIVFTTWSGDASWTPPVDKILAYAHGGRIFTETLPLLARITLAVGAFFFASWWIAFWGLIFRDYERWSLVCAALVHFAVLMLAYLFGRVAWLRLHHLRHIPPGETAALRSFPIILRWVAETLFILSVAVSVEIYAMPSSPPPQVLGKADTAFGALGEVIPNPFASVALGVGASLSSAVWSLCILLLFYALANFVETYLAIELNTRNHPGRTKHHDDLVRQSED